MESRCLGCRSCQGSACVCKKRPLSRCGLSRSPSLRVSRRVSVCGGEGAGGGCPSPGAGPAQPIWGRRDVRGAPGAGRGPGRGQVTAGGAAAAAGSRRRSLRRPARLANTCLNRGVPGTRPAQLHQLLGQRTCTSAAAEPCCCVLMNGDEALKPQKRSMRASLCRWELDDSTYGIGKHSSVSLTGTRGCS